MYQDYKGKQIQYDEHSNKWGIRQFEGEEFDSLKAAKEYIDKQAKAAFKRFRALAEGKMGEITSIAADGRRAWFTPDKKDEGYYGGRQMVTLRETHPIAENKELVDRWLEISVKLKELEDRTDVLEKERQEINEKMKSYVDLHPELEH